MSTAITVILAHHEIVAALPFVLPTVLITLTVVALVVRDRRRGDSAEKQETLPPEM